MEEEIKFKHFMPAQIRFSDVDQFGHVNNSVYFSCTTLRRLPILRMYWACLNGAM